MTILLITSIICGYSDQELSGSGVPYYANTEGKDLMCGVSWVVSNEGSFGDSAKLENYQPDASRVTLGKIALESLGAAAGGVLGGFVGSVIVGDKEFWQGAAATTGIIAGLAGGTTLVGNELMEPNGSFIGSLIGSAIGTGLGAGVLVLTALAYLGWEPGMEADWTLAYCGSGLAVLLPISGAVIGYNHRILR